MPGRMAAACFPEAAALQLLGWELLMSHENNLQHAGMAWLTAAVQSERRNGQQLPQGSHTILHAAPLQSGNLHCIHHSSLSVVPAIRS